MRRNLATREELEKRVLRCVVQSCLIFESADKDEFVSYAEDKH